MYSKEIENKKKKLRLKPIQKEILVGTLLGDSCLQSLNNGRTYRLKVEHSILQKEYVDWLYQKFQDWVRTPPQIKKKSGKKKEYWNYGFETLSVGNFRFFAQQFYDEDGKKKVSRMIKKLLTPRALAVWFMDDGSIKSRKHKGYNIHTLSFSKEDQKLLQKALKEKFGIETSLHRQRKYKELKWRLYIKGESGEKFREIIKPFILPSLEYKIG